MRGSAVVSAVNGLFEGIGTKSGRSAPGLEPELLIRDEIATTDQFIPVQPPEVFRNAGFREFAQIDATHHARLGFTSSNTIPPTSASAPTTGGI